MSGPNAPDVNPAADYVSRMVIYLPEDTRRRARAAAAMDGKTVSAWTTELIEAALRRPR